MSICIAGLSLATCGNNDDQSKANSSLKAENSSLKAANTSNSKQAEPTVDKYDNAEYALAAYLKFQKTDASSLTNTENMTWQQQGNRYIIGFGGHTTTMTVNKNDVLVTYDDVEGDHMGSGNGHKAYSKAELAQFIKEQKDDIDNLLRNHNSSAGTKNVNNSTAKESESNSSTTSENSSNDDETTSSGHHNNQQGNNRVQTSGFNANTINNNNNTQSSSAGNSTNGANTSNQNNIPQ